MFEAEPAEEVVFSAEVVAAPAEPMEVEAEEAAAGETSNDKGATAEDTPVEEFTPDEEKDGPLEEPAAMNSASPDEMLRAAGVHDEAGWSAGLVGLEEADREGGCLYHLQKLRPHRTPRADRDQAHDPSSEVKQGWRGVGPASAGRTGQGIWNRAGGDGVDERQPLHP